MRRLALCKRLTVSTMEEARHLTKSIGVSNGDAGGVVQLTYNPGSMRPQIVMNRLELMGKIEGEEWLE